MLAASSALGHLGHVKGGSLADMATQRLHSSSFLGLPYRNLKMNPKKELLWSPWVDVKVWDFLSFWLSLQASVNVILRF